MEGSKIKRIRLSSGMIQEEFAKKFNVSRTTVINWENGTRNLSPKKFKAIRDFCIKENIKFDLLED